MRPRGVIVLFIALGVLALQAGIAHAAPPSNDLSSSPIAITALPYSNTQSTAEATTDADDAEMNPSICGAPATDASVWYALTLPSDALVRVDVSSSDYSAGVLVSTGPAGARNFITCGPQVVVFDAAAGETYYMLVIDDQLDGAGNGGNLSISVDVAPPPPDVHFTVDPTGTVYQRDGSAVVHGTSTCSGQANFAELDGFVKQFIGRVAITGSFFTDIPCDGSTHPWTAIVYPDNGRFGGGKLQVGAEAFACNDFGCGSDSLFTTVNLKGKGKK
jgi:hypothetical protein